MQQFRRSGQRDDRRRRVLNESLLTPAEEAGPARRRRRSARYVRLHKSLHYGDATFLDEQPRLTDFVPISLVAYGVLLILGLAVIAGLEALYYWMPQWAAATTDGRIESFDLDGEGSLAVWFSSMVLFLTAVASMVVLYVRQYRTDDYQGRYRIWLWAALCWLAMSLDETASLHEGFKELMTLATGTRIVGDGSLWWVIPYFFTLGAIGTRLLVDVRECRLSAGMMISAAGCYGLAVLAQLGWILPEAGARGVMIEEGAEMTGSWLLLLSVLLYARHVVLDAEGYLAERSEATADPDPAKPEAESEVKPEGLAADDAETRSIKIHPPHGVPRPLRAKPAEETPRKEVAAPSPVARTPDRPPPSEEEGEEGQDDDESSSTEGIDPTLSRAERRAMRKRLKRQQRQQKRVAG